MRAAAFGAIFVMLLGADVSYTQTRADRDKARVQNRLGWDEMQREAWDKAARSFQNAIDLDAGFEIPYYGLGRANMALKQFSDAVAAYEQCRDLYREQAGRQFSNAQEAQRYRSDRLIELDEQIRFTQTGPMTLAKQDLLRQLQILRRDLQDRIQRGNSMTIANPVPAYVSLALGSAYFRAGRLSDAEKEYQATIAADSRSGEAHSNLAVVYFETQRFADALKALDAAKKTGFRVNPELEKAIREKAK